MNILDVYARYQLPPNLIRHQLEVAAVGQYVCLHWNGEPIDAALITQTLLLHDMGNIIKFKRPFLGELEKDSAHWENVQNAFVKKYGTDVHTATLAIVGELKLPTVATLINDMRTVWFDPRESLSFEARICEFADCCVTPTGITTFEKRIADLKERYGYTEESGPIRAARSNARIICQHVSVDLSSIEHEKFSSLLENLVLYEFSSGIVV